MNAEAPMGPLTAQEENDLLRHVRDAWSLADPVPPTLAERVLFAVQLEGLDVELAVLVEELLVGTGARAEEAARTLTFESDNLTVTVTMSETFGGTRIDGWIAPAKPLRVEVRRPDMPSQEVFADDGGRFVIERVTSGTVQFVFHPVADGLGATSTPVAAPPVRL
jgi:hypothetical protein